MSFPQTIRLIWILRSLNSNKEQGSHLFPYQSFLTIIKYTPISTSFIRPSFFLMIIVRQILVNYKPLFFSALAHFLIHSCVNFSVYANGQFTQKLRASQKETHLRRRLSTETEIGSMPFFRYKEGKQQPSGELPV